MKAMAKKQSAVEPAEDLEAQVDRVLEEMRPYIHSHGGEVNVIEVTPEGIARLQMVGSCNGCPMSMLTMRLGIERLLAEKLPQLKGAEAVFVDDFEWPEIEADDPAG
jgi:Fe-S cluster biogenesis protein NfuA